MLRAVLSYVTMFPDQSRLFTLILFGSVLFKSMSVRKMLDKH